MRRRQSRREKTNKAVRTEPKAQSREQLSTQEERPFMPRYFLSVTGLLLIRTDTIFRQGVSFKLMVSLKIFSGFHCYSWHSNLLSLTLTQQSSYMCLVLSTCLNQYVVRTWLFCCAKSPMKNDWSSCPVSGGRWRCGHEWCMLKVDVGTDSK